MGISVTRKFIGYQIKKYLMGNSRLLKIRVPRIQIHDLSVSDRDPMAKPAELVLALIIANIHWQKLVMHQMTIFVPEPL